MTYFTPVGREYLPAGATAPSPVMIRDTEDPAFLHEGLYYRSRVYPGLHIAIENCLKDNSFQELSLDAYQAWNETAWKQPQASLAAAERFIKKGQEEQLEIDDALEDYWFDPKHDVTHLVEELGDYQYSMAALVSNGGGILSDGVKRRLFDHIQGTRVFGANGRVEYPVWYSTAAHLAIKQGSITLGDIDGLLEAGFVPQYSAAMNIHPDENEICSTEYLFDFQTYIAYLNGVAHEQFADIKRYKSSNRDPTAIARDFENVGAESLFRIAAIAHYAGSKLTDVVAANIAKINHRVATGTVDKADGPRD